MKIEIANVTKQIRKALILDSVNLTFESGHIYGLYGPNGSGKTMLMRLIAGLILPTAGTVTLDGKTLGEDIDFYDSMGVLIETPSFLPGLTGLQNLLLLARIHRRIDDNVISQSLRDVGLEPEDKRKFRKYSLGMKQRLGIAAAIMEEPDIILLDEPTNALDRDGIAQICQLIRREKERGALLILACHEISVLEAICDEIILVCDGRFQRRVQP